MEIENLEDCIDFVKDYKIGDKVLIVSAYSNAKPQVVKITNIKRKYIQVSANHRESSFDKETFKEKPQYGYSPRAYICGKVDYIRMTWLNKHALKITNSISKDYETLKKIAELIGYNEVD